MLFITIFKVRPLDGLMKRMTAMTTVQVRDFSSTNDFSVRSWLALLFTRKRRAPDVVDIRNLSDHLKRDMGFLDGNRPEEKTYQLT
ncbi:hypothetical protein [Ensifer sp. MJa1]|uniref:hypothetical protein n=1 Tax=Ensifer sp. MJa1 TaxID=2919888 RepID=UPI00300BD12B